MYWISESIHLLNRLRRQLIIFLSVLGPGIIVMVAGQDLAEMVAKYHYRMIPVVHAQDRMSGVIHYNDIKKDLVTRVKI